MNATATPAPPKADAPWRTFTLKQRIQLWLITWAGYLVIRILGPTIRFSVSWEDGSPKSVAERPYVYSFWHNCMIPAMYWCRDLQVRVMSSDSFDGEYTGRIMQKFGFEKVRGSSSKGAVRALLGMRRELGEFVDDISDPILLPMSTITISCSRNAAARTNLSSCRSGCILP